LDGGGKKNWTIKKRKITPGWSIVRPIGPAERGKKKATKNQQVQGQGLGAGKGTLHKPEIKRGVPSARLAAVRHKRRLCEKKKKGENTKSKKETGGGGTTMKKKLENCSQKKYFIIKPKVVEGKHKRKEGKAL